MIEAGHFVEVENILRLTLRETMSVSVFLSHIFGLTMSLLPGAEMIKYPQILTISLKIKSKTRKKELKMASKHLSFPPL